jgi:tRNA A-37 threonylcarbamoyl transferase component Bud32
MMTAMRFQKADDFIYCCANDPDADYVRDVARLVYAGYHGESAQWQLQDSPQMWRISLGGRAAVVGVRLQGRVCCVKLFYDERFQTRLRTRLGLSKGRRAYQNGLRLQQAGVNCPPMWGYAERRPSGPALVVTALADDCLRVDHWAVRRGVPRAAVLALARFLRAMHDTGISHVDMSPRNIMVRVVGARYEFFLLDYEDARFAARVSRRTRLENLHHLHERMMQHVSARDRLRFLREYAGADYRVCRDTLRRRIDVVDTGTPGPLSAPSRPVAPDPSAVAASQGPPPAGRRRV